MDSAKREYFTFNKRSYHKYVEIQINKKSQHKYIEIPVKKKHHIYVVISVRKQSLKAIFISTECNIIISLYYINKLKANFFMWHFNVFFQTLIKICAFK